MRPVLLSDLTAVARALLRAPYAERQVLCARIIFEAEMADRFARRLRKPHPQWGNGTLIAASAQRALAAERTFDDTDYGA